MRMLCPLAGLFFSAFSSLCAAQTAEPTCADIQDQTGLYTACSFDPKQVDIRLHLADPDGRIYGAFDPLRRQLWAERRVLLFAMNAGMYHDDRSPVGLFVDYGHVVKPAITGGGWGNFHLLPNGVFLMKDGRAEVVETLAYQTRGVTPDFATQSGPMLVIDGKLHPRFLPDSDSLKIRNGVGVDGEGRVHMVISKVPVRFYDFATLFRDRLGCRNALYLDGSISSAFIADQNRDDRLFPMGPILSVSMPIPQ
jgi:uncharacterized protein YigE (DUF2233 family)